MPVICRHFYLMYVFRSRIYLYLGLVNKFRAWCKLDGPGATHSQQHLVCHILVAAIVLQKDSEIEVSWCIFILRYCNILSV